MNLFCADQRSRDMQNLQLNTFVLIIRPTRPQTRPRRFIGQNIHTITNHQARKIITTQPYRINSFSEYLWSLATLLFCYQYTVFMSTRMLIMQHAVVEIMKRSDFGNSQFSDPIELEKLTLLSPQNLISTPPCLLEKILKVSRLSDLYFLR